MRIRPQPTLLRWLLTPIIVLGFSLSQPSGANPPTPQQTARAWYDIAMKHTKSGAFGKAAVAFEAAFKLDPDPTLLYNAARSYHRAGRLREAKKLYQRYIGMPKVRAADRRTAVTRIQAVDRALQAHRIIPKPKPIRVTRTLRVPRSSNALHRWGWISLGSGIALGLVAGILKGIAASERADFKARSQPSVDGVVWGISQYDAYATRDRTNRLDTGALSALVIGVSLAVTGTVLLTRPRPSTRTMKAIGLSFGPGGLQLTAGGTF